MPIDYPAIFEPILKNALASRTTLPLHTILTNPALSSVTGKTIKSHLKRFISNKTQYVGTVEGLLPDDDALIEIIEHKIGSPINSDNVVDANHHCAEIVKSAAEPVLKTFVLEKLSKNFAGGSLQISVEDLIGFLLDDYDAFSRGVGNGLVSTAGRMNEKLLMVCLENVGLVKKKNFTKTGTKSDADIVIHSTAGSKPRLGVEVKSYHARERLLRGLKDVTRPKVGAGYFVDEKEFNESRASALIQAGTASVYLPNATLVKIDKKVQDMIVYDAVAANSKFFRPIENFANDMKFFCANGKLPKF
ncbi:hypothetical protein [Ruegeria arenilitoris]|uniref:hypothetical protein n=1 Tax=Ruegeria arenilitoris TaxID=1173585 RepID=UPI00147B48C0|nr:hypothetical protein [Ruegeria arenilitoris]